MPYITVTSSMHYKGTRKKLPEIAHELKVKAVVEPSVQRSGERLEINVQLIYGPTDRHLWARLYECDRKDVQKILSKVAQDLISELKVQATKDEMARVSSSKQVSHEAYETYLKGLYHLRKGTRAERTKAREHFEKAIELDPSFARPYASLAFMYAHGGVVRVGEGELADRSAVRQWASKALELDETLAQAHSALGWVDLSDWNWRDAEQEFKRAIELNPNLSGARAWYAQFLGALQRYDEAFAQAKVAQELDPASPDLVSHAVWAYYVAGRVDEAMTRWRAVVDLEPNYWGAHFFLAQGYLTKGMYQEAIAELQKSISVSERSHANLRYLAYAYAKSGQRSEALKIISEMETRNLRVSALVYVGLGDKDKALAQLEKNYENHGAGLFFANTDPLLQPLHNDPRFQDLMRRVGLPTAKAK